MNKFMMYTNDGVPNEPVTKRKLMQLMEAHKKDRWYWKYNNQSVAVLSSQWFTLKNIGTIFESIEPTNTCIIWCKVHTADEPASLEEEEKEENEQEEVKEAEEEQAEEMHDDSDAPVVSSHNSKSTDVDILSLCGFTNSEQNQDLLKKYFVVFLDDLLNNRKLVEELQYNQATEASLQARQK